MSSPHNIIDKQSENVLAIVSLGSNLGSDKGDSAEILRQALIELQALSLKPLLTSSFYRTAPIDSPPDAPDFLNAITLLRLAPQNLSAVQLLQNLLQIEAEFGRRRGCGVNEPRSLDLDLISFGDLQLRTAALELPHPRAHLRGFVMAPLAEVAPDCILPGQAQTARELSLSLISNQSISRL